MEIRLDEITVDPEIQLAARGVDQSTVANYVDALTNDAKLPPVVTFRENGTLWLADGFHRVQAHAFLGMTRIDADIKNGTRQDAMIYAALANVVHGKPMSQREKREAGERLLQLTAWEDKDIGKKLSVDRETVRLWRKQLVSSKVLEDTPTRTVTRGDTTYTMDTANIGKREYEPAEPTTPNSFFAVGEDDIIKRARQIREEQRAKVAESKPEPPPLPTDKYIVLYADPPWCYGDKLVDGYGTAENHYPSMTIEELCDMPVYSLAHSNAVLFMWVTSPLLEECFSVINAWGFKYKTSFVWDKVKHNYGHYNSVRHELLLICTRGSCLPENGKLHDSVVEIDRSDIHSQKPEYFRELIDKMYPTGRRIELFARKPAAGWDAWGNDV